MGHTPPRKTAVPILPWHPLLMLWVVTIIFVTVCGLLGTRLVAPTFDWGHGATAITSGIDTPAGRFVRWDSGYYVRIAQDGYRVDGAERAFFPLYPLLTRLISATVGLPLLWSGLLLSAACFFGAILMLRRLILLDHGAPIASRATLWFCASPFSFFFVAFYPEALFLLLSISSIYLARQGNFLAAGIVIALVGATRPTGFLLAIPYAAEFFVQRDFRLSRWRAWVGGAAIAPLGACAYLAFLAVQAGSNNPLAVYDENLAVNWQMKTTWPWVSLADSFAAVAFGANIGADWFSRAVVWQDTLAALTGIALALWAFRRLRLSYGLLFVGSMCFYLTSHGAGGYVFESMPRHLISIVPLYPALAMAQERFPERLRWLPIAISLTFLGLFSAWFASGRWVAWTIATPRHTGDHASVVTDAGARSARRPSKRRCAPPRR